MGDKVDAAFLAEVDAWARVMRQGRRSGQSNLMLVIKNGLGYVDGGSVGTRWSHRLDELEGALLRIPDVDRHIIRTEFLKPPFGEDSTDGLKRSRRMKARRIRLPGDTSETQGIYLREYEARLETALWRWQHQLETYEKTG